MFRCLQYKSFENIVGKGEIAYIKQFLLFQQCFPPFSRTFCHFHQFKIVACKLFQCGSLQFVVWEGLNRLKKVRILWERGENDRHEKHNLFQQLFSLNSLSNNNILGLSKLKAPADDKINGTRNLNFVFGRVENIVGKGENAGYQHFLLCLKCFPKAFFHKDHWKLDPCTNFRVQRISDFLLVLHLDKDR